MGKPEYPGTVAASQARLAQATAAFYKRRFAELVAGGTARGEAEQTAVADAKRWKREQEQSSITLRRGVCHAMFSIAAGGAVRHCQR